MRSFFETPDKKIRRTLLAGDMSAIILSLYFSAILTMHAQGSIVPLLDSMRKLATLAQALVVADILLLFTAIFMAVGLLHIAVYKASGLYQIRPAMKQKSLAARLIIAVAVAILVASFIMDKFEKNPFTVEMWALHAVSLFLLLLFWRWAYLGRRVVCHPYRVVVIDADALSQKAADRLLANGNESLFALTYTNQTEFFDRMALPGNHQAHRVQLIVYPFAADFSDHHLVSLIREKFAGVSISDSLTFFKNCTGSFPVLEINDRWLINLSVSLTVMNSIQKRIKRMLDVVLATIGVVVTLPVMALIAILIKATSKGPVLFVQERLGLHQMPFRFYKFRTMIEDAEKDTGPVWAQKNDPRVTPVGRFLRKSRLDELPQLVNVIKGDMSIVGPRPIRKVFADKLSAQFPYYYLRFYVKPGLTGWAQILGTYGESIEGQREKLEYDLFYIHEYSLVMDAAIMLKTFDKAFMCVGQ